MLIQRRALLTRDPAWANPSFDCNFSLVKIHLLHWSVVTRIKGLFDSMFICNWNWRWTCISLCQCSGTLIVLQKLNDIINLFMRTYLCLILLNGNCRRLYYTVHHHIPGAFIITASSFNNGFLLNSTIGVYPGSCSCSWFNCLQQFCINIGVIELQSIVYL